MMKLLQIDGQEIEEDDLEIYQSIKESVDLVMSLTLVTAFNIYDKDDVLDMKVSELLKYLLDPYLSDEEKSKLDIFNKSVVSHSAM